MYIFDENDVFYRCPGEALAVPGTLDLAIKLKRGEAVNPRVFLRPDGGENTELAMEYDRAAGTYDVYRLTLRFDKAGLYWYHFLIESTYGASFTVPEHQGGGFQVTVYTPSEKTPGWIQGGVIYHVFVDRFFRGGEWRLRPGAVQRPDWGGCPYYLPDEKGVVHNNDFFGGDLYGIIEKLPYLEELGVTCIYLSPVFEATSNHKYDTSDFMKIDTSFGGDEALIKLCKVAGARGIKVILDGVFNHVGSDSRYFNRYGRYEELGAYQSDRSPYRDWFTFREDGKYEAWWGIELLPAVNKHNEGYKKLICGEKGVIEHWMERGVSGWRLDVVDELPDVFLDPLCTAMKKQNSAAYIVGEVWEDASNKIAYSARRRYFLGGQLDSVTNYPLKNSIIACVKEGNIFQLASTMAMLCRNYPKVVLDSLMNILGTHDTMRILTALGGSDFPEGKVAMSNYRLCPSEMETARKRLKLAAALQFTLPGVPCVYYGDEAGMDGGADPFNRRCYPWGFEDQNLLAWYKTISRIRRTHACFKDGKYELMEARLGVFSFTRGEGAERVLTAVNVSDGDRILGARGFNYDLLRDEQVDVLKLKAGEAGLFAIR